jgi:hypothetical protein
MSTAGDQFQNISLSTTIMNRLWLLKKALPTWVDKPFKHIHILNWNSSDSKELHEYCDSFEDKRIVVEDVYGKRTAYFNAPISRNMAAERALELSDPKWLMQIDCDILINDNFQHLSLPDEEIVYLSKWTRYLLDPRWADNDATFQKNSTDLAIVEANRMKYGEFGTCLIPAKKVFKWGYYNENFIENCLFDTLYMAEFFKHDFDSIWFFRDELTHIPHDNKTRVANGPEGGFVRAIQVNQALSALKPYRYPYKVIVNPGLIEIG